MRLCPVYVRFMWKSSGYMSFLCPEPNIKAHFYVVPQVQWKAGLCTDKWHDLELKYNLATYIYH